MFFDRAARLCAEQNNEVRTWAVAISDDQRYCTCERTVPTGACRKTVSPLFCDAGAEREVGLCARDRLAVGAGDERDLRSAGRRAGRVDGSTAPSRCSAWIGTRPSKDGRTSAARAGVGL